MSGFDWLWQPGSLSEIALRRATGNLPPALVAKALAWIGHYVIDEGDYFTADELDQLSSASFEVRS